MDACRFGNPCALCQDVERNLKNKKEQAMSIEKKSLISNRTASKKAIVTKPVAVNVAPAKLAKTSVRLQNPSVKLPRTNMKTI
jgi:hypothetical protein